MIRSETRSGPRRGGFSFLELMMAVTVLLTLWALAMSSAGPGLARARAARVTLHRNAAQNASMMAYFHAGGRVPRSGSELRAHVTGRGPGQDLMFHQGPDVVEIRPDGRGGVQIREASR